MTNDVKNSTVHVWDTPFHAHQAYARQSTETKETLDRITKDSSRVPPSTQISVTSGEPSALESLFQTNMRKDPAHVDPPPGEKSLVSNIKNQAAQIFGSPMNLRQQLVTIDQFVQQQPNSPLLANEQTALHNLIEKGEIPRQTDTNLVLGRMASILQG